MGIGTNSVRAGAAGFKAYLIIRDKYGRIVVDESVFHDPKALEKLRQEVIKNVRNTSNSDT